MEYPGLKSNYWEKGLLEYCEKFFSENVTPATNKNKEQIGPSQTQNFTISKTK